MSVLDTLAVLPHVLWEEPEDAISLSDWVEENALPDGGGEQLEFLLSSVRGRVAAAAEEEPVAEEDVALKNDVNALATAALNTVTEMQGHLSALEDARDHLYAAAASGDHPTAVTTSCARTCRGAEQLKR